MVSSIEKNLPFLLKSISLLYNQAWSIIHSINMSHIYINRWLGSLCTNLLQFIAAILISLISPFKVKCNNAAKKFIIIYECFRKINRIIQFMRVLETIYHTICRQAT